MNTLVTGAHGFVGSHLVEALLKRGHKVRALVSPWGKLGNLRAVLDHPRLELVRADITEPESLRGSCKDTEVVFHAAARATYWGPWEAFHKANVQGTQHVLGEAQRHGTRRFVFVSSVSVHRYSGFRNADPRTRPRDGGSFLYARSKIQAEDFVMEARLEGVIVRPGLFLHGPRDTQFVRYVEPLQGKNVPAVMRPIAPSLPMVGSGKTVINMAYVENLADGLALAGEVGAAAGKVYVIADDGCPSWLEVFYYLADLIGAPRPKLHLPPAFALAFGSSVETAYRLLLPKKDPVLTRYLASLMVNDVHFSTEHAKRELGYRPRFTWQEGLERSVRALGV